MSSRGSRRRARILAAAALALSVAALLLSAAALHSLLSCCVRISVVATSSMEPSVPRYSFVLLTRDYPGWIPVGEVVLYEAGGSGQFILHRLVNARLWGDLYTRGDATPRSERVEPRQVWGVLDWGVPRAALVPVRISTDPGAVLVVALFIAGVTAGALASRVGW